MISFTEKRALQKVIFSNRELLSGESLSFADKRSAQKVIFESRAKLGSKKEALTEKPVKSSDNFWTTFDEEDESGMITMPKSNIKKPEPAQKTNGIDDELTPEGRESSQTNDLFGDNENNQEDTTLVPEQLESDTNTVPDQLNISGDFKSSIEMIKGIDDGAEFAKGMTRSLFVNSIAGKLKTLHKNGEQKKIDDVLQYIRQDQEGRKKPILSARNSAWKLESDSDNEPKTIGEIKGVETETEVDNKPELVISDIEPDDSQTQPTKNEGIENSEKDKLKADLEIELNALMLETDPNIYDEKLDDLEVRIESAGLIEEMDGILNTVVDKFTELLAKIEQGASNSPIPEIEQRKLDSKVEALQNKQADKITKEDFLFVIDEMKKINPTIKAKDINDDDGVVTGFVTADLEHGEMNGRFKLGQIPFQIKNGKSSEYFMAEKEEAAKLKPKNTALPKKPSTPKFSISGVATNLLSKDLPEKERSFVDSIKGNKALSIKQKQWLKKIADKFSVEMNYTPRVDAFDKNRQANNSASSRQYAYSEAEADRLFDLPTFDKENNRWYDAEV